MLGTVKLAVKANPDAIAGPRTNAIYQPGLTVRQFPTGTPECLDCSNRERDKHGRCSRCQSDAIYDR